MSWKTALQFGLPFLSFVVLSSFILKEISSIRYEVSAYKKRYARSDVSNEYTGSKRTANNMSYGNNDADDDEDIRMLKEIVDSNKDWKNIRGPRPWEKNEDYNNLVSELKKRGTSRIIVNPTSNKEE